MNYQHLLHESSILVITVCADGGIGRREGLKIPCPKDVRVRFPLCAPFKDRALCSIFNLFVTISITMSIILLIHILSASLLTVGMIGLLIYGILRKQRRTVVNVAHVGFGATLVSGLILVIISPRSLTHLCIMMTAYSLATFGLEALYKKRTKSALHTSATTI